MKIDIGYDTDDVFAVAVRIEENGTVFYSKAASVADAPDATKLLSALALAERRHIEVFRGLLKSRSPLASRSYADNVLSNFRHTVADRAVFNTKEDPCAALEGLSLEGIIRAALQRERDAIEFYGDIREMMSLESDREQVDAIIEEETHHLHMLSNWLTATGD
jgi:rubrerythrin